MSRDTGAIRIFFIEIRCELRSFGNMAPRKPSPGRVLEARFEALLGGHGTTAHLARALNRSPSTLHRIWARTGDPPEELVALAEFLEQVGPDEWPERWRK